MNPTPAELPALVFNYQSVTLNIHNTGHTIQVTYPEGSWIEVDGTKYHLLQFHFHAPSEHTVAGQPSDIEMHLVHESEEGTLAVIGVLIESGRDNAEFIPIWHHLPSTPGESKHSGDVIFNAVDLLPSQKTRVSLRWFVDDSSLFRRSQVVRADNSLSRCLKHKSSAFKSIMSGNNRPVQPLNGRELLVDTVKDKPM